MSSISYQIVIDNLYPWNAGRERKDSICTLRE